MSAPPTGDRTGHLKRLRHVAAVGGLGSGVDIGGLPHRLECGDLMLALCSPDERIGLKTRHTTEMGHALDLEARLRQQSLEGSVSEEADVLPLNRKVLIEAVECEG